MAKKTKQQKVKKKAILKLLKGQTVDEAIANLQELSRLNFGQCKIDIVAHVSKLGYYGVYDAKVNCNLLVPVEEE